MKCCCWRIKSGGSSPKPVRRAEPPPSEVRADLCACWCPNGSTKLCPRASGGLVQGFQSKDLSGLFGVCWQPGPIIISSVRFEESRREPSRPVLLIRMQSSHSCDFRSKINKFVAFSFYKNQSRSSAFPKKIGGLKLFITLDRTLPPPPTPDAPVDPHHPNKI